MSKRPQIYNTIHNVLGETGVATEVADRLCDQIGNDFLDAVRDQLAERCEKEPLPRRLGHTEAVLRWCPHVREVTPVGKGKKDAQIGNRYIDGNGQEFSNPTGCACIASYCMAWRWLDPIRGFCGLAGPLHYQPVGEPRPLPTRTPLERPSASLQRDLFDEYA